MAKEIEQALATLVAKDQIRDLVFAYCRAADRRDYDLLETLYHPGAGDEHGANPSGTADEFFAFMRSRPGSTVTQHAVTNHLIKVDGDRAEGEVYLVAYHVSGADPTRSFLLGGRYLDRYERRDGVWKFAHRRVVADWVSHGTAEAIGDAPEIAGIVAGERGPGDTSYGFFDLFRRGER